MKKLLFAFLILGSTAAFAQKTDFTGTYKIDLEKTKFGAAPQGVLAVTVGAKQEKGKIAIAKTTTEGKVNSDEFAFDGAVLTKVLEDGGSSVSNLKWSEDKKTFTLDRKVTNKEGKLLYGVKETWSLADLGKTLILDRDVEQSNGMKYNIKGYYTKQ